MAAVRRVLKLLKITYSNGFNKSFSTTVSTSKRLHIFKIACGCALGGGVLFYISSKANNGTVYAFKTKKKEDELLSGAASPSAFGSKAVKLTSRERRFIKFASVEYDGQVYMTPQDFLESFVDQDPRPRLKRRTLTTIDIASIKDSTPNLSQGSTVMFRSLRDKGIISFTEYLFLLSILTKPQTGFRIAFNMFDTDGNERVDKNEFLVLRRLFAQQLDGRRGDTNKNKSVSTDSSLQKTPHSKNTDSMETIFSHAWKDKHGLGDEALQQLNNEKSAGGSITEEFIDDEQGLQRRHVVDTTLIVHFFGPTGDNELKYEGFRRFMENLQTEVLEMEFNEFSKGAPTISEMDFARILLRYTYLSTDIYDMYVNRLLDRVDADIGITFPEFRVFGQFLNNLEDFMIAMRMYTLADHPISKDEFLRAVKICTGQNLSQHVVDTVFAIFDEDGDGQLSYREFIAIVKNRLHRGVKVNTKNEGWEAFRSCVKQEIKSPC
ncbi:mitochondrial calcium uptake 3 isoform X1 [Lycorma delicatula]|uniref:mitochondrial calcium uptake 3 isoform X1 n=1 Tax=Lycorma delicatula TaxID=130591 RepID=UPI003F513301